MDGVDRDACGSAAGVQAVDGSPGHTVETTCRDVPRRRAETTICENFLYC
jgi:hypothetical protein